MSYLIGRRQRLCRDGAIIAPASILAQGTDLIEASTRTFSRASQRYSVAHPGTILAVDEMDECTSELFPGINARIVSLQGALTRNNNADISTWPAVGCSAAGSGTRWTVTPDGATANPEISVAQGSSSNTVVRHQFRITKDSAPIRIHVMSGSRISYIDFDPATGTFGTGTAAGGALVPTARVADMGTEWLVYTRHSLNWNVTQTSRIYFVDALDGSTAGPFTAPITLDFVQISRSNAAPGPYIPGAGTNVAGAADSLTLDPLPYTFASVGEIWTFPIPTWWGDSFGGQSAGGSTYVGGFGHLAAGTEPWRTWSLGTPTQGDGSSNGGGNATRGNGGTVPAASVAAFSGAQAGYWKNRKRGWLGGSWTGTQTFVHFDLAGVVGDAAMVSANLPAGAQPPHPFSRINLYPSGSALSASSCIAMWGWPRQLTPAERKALSLALLRPQLPMVYP
jgi:hypothetical protein